MPWTVRTTLTIALAGALLQLYVAARTVSAISTLTGWSKGRLRIAAGAILVYLAVLPLSSLIAYAFGFSTSFQASSIFDRAFTYPFWIGIVLGAQVFIVVLAMDLVKLVLLPIYRRKKAGWQTVEAWMIVIAVGLASLYVSARVYSDTFLLRTRSTELQIANLPPGLNGLRIVHIADMQVDSRTGASKLDPYINAVNSLNPDLILFSGDAVTSGTSFIEQAAEAMGKLKARFGVVACVGDHDYFSDRKLVVDLLRARGIVVLENSTTTLAVHDGSIVITGVTNVYRNNVSENTLNKLAQQRSPASLSILLTHQPSTWLVRVAAEREYDLFLGGHTHGGQIVFPLPGFLLTGSSFETNYVTGFYRVGSMLVSINNGLGLTLAPIRYNAPAEVTLIVLK
jgi:predicted MPP superfamily phosphohydrolase